MLVLGASGGVGTGCVMLAKMLGAEVIACASSAEKLARLKAMGADEAIDYTKTDWSKWAVEKYGKPQRRTYDGGVDVVINFTGGDTWVPSLRCLKRGGKLLVCGATAGYDPKEDLRYVWSFELQIIGSNSFYDDNLAALMELIGAGKIKPVIDKVLPLEQAARRPAPDPGPRGHRQSGGDAVSDDITLEQVQALITRAPFHQWLGLTVVAVGDDSIEIKATWREEWVVNPERRYTHGGMLAALIDLAADWAMVKQTGRGVPTIDMRVDYHRAAMPGDLIARGKVVRVGCAVLHRRGADFRSRTASCSPAAAALISRRRRNRHERMTGSSNLGDLIRRDRDLGKDRDHRSRRRAAAPREFTLRAARRDGERRRPRARQARLAARRPGRDAVRQPRRIYRRLLRHHARRLRRGAGEFQVPARHHRFHHPRRRREARVLRCDRARRIARPTSPMRDIRRARSMRFLDPGPFDAVIPAQDEPAMFLYTSGSTGTPKGVVLSHQSHIWVVETRLGGQDSTPPLSDRRAALSHECAGAGKARLRGACHDRAAAAIFRAPPISRRSERYRCTWLTAVPPMIAMMLRETELLGAHRSFQRRIRAHGLGAGQRRA